MKRDILLKYWNVIEAFKNGKEIQYYSKIKSKWITTENPAFQEDFKYRIKPVKKLTKENVLRENEIYEPFKSVSEFIDEFYKRVTNRKREKGNLPTIWIQNRSGQHFTVNSVVNTLELSGVFISDRNQSLINFELLHRQWMFEDGTPCGKLISKE